MITTPTIHTIPAGSTRTWDVPANLNIWRADEYGEPQVTGEVELPAGGSLTGPCSYSYRGDQ